MAGSCVYLLKWNEMEQIALETFSPFERCGNVHE